MAATAARSATARRSDRRRREDSTTCVGPHRRGAAGLQGRQQRALGIDRGTRGRIVQRGERAHQLGIVDAAFDGQGTRAGAGSSTTGRTPRQ